MSECEHPSRRQYWWTVRDELQVDEAGYPVLDGYGGIVTRDMLHGGCCDCGEVLPSQVLPRTKAYRKARRKAAA